MRSRRAGGREQEKYNSSINLHHLNRRLHPLSRFMSEVSVEEGTRVVEWHLPFAVVMGHHGEARSLIRELTQRLHDGRVLRIEQSFLADSHEILYKVTLPEGESLPLLEGRKDGEK
jgi:hypothetical protein